MMKVSNVLRMQIRLALITMALACITTNAVSAKEQNGELLRQQFLGIEITIPDNWYNATEAGVTDQLVLASREKDKAYLLISRLPGQKRTLESFDRATRHFIFTEMGGFLDEEKHITVTGEPAYLWTYQGKSRIAENGWRKFYRVVSKQGDDFVVFHGVVDPDDFLKYRGNIEDVIKSTVWINTEFIGE